MAKIVPVEKLAAHAKSSTLYGMSNGRTSKFFRLDGLLLFRIVMGLLYYNITASSKRKENKMNHQNDISD